MIDRQYSSYCFLASELSIEKKVKYSRQAANSQSMGFVIDISHELKYKNVFEVLKGKGHDFEDRPNWLPLIRKSQKIKKGKQNKKSLKTTKG
jgi:hypothetical protein